MATYWRSGEGRKIIDTTAHWVLAVAALRGLTVWDYIEGRCSNQTFSAARSRKSGIP